MDSYQGLVFKFSDKMRYTRSIAEELLETCAERQDAIREAQGLVRGVRGRRMHLWSRGCGWQLSSKAPTKQEHQPHHFMTWPAFTHP